MKIILTFSVMVVSIFCASAAEKILDVYVLTGQSNSLGIIKDGESKKLKPNSVDKKIKFFWVDRDPRGNIVSTSKGKISHLQSQKYDDGKDEVHWGLEISCFRKLYKSGRKNNMLIKASRGGGGNAYWFKDSKNHHMYDAVLSAVGDSCKQLDKEGIKYRIVGLLYLQGESDGKDSAIADKRAKALLENLRKDLPNAEKMKMFIGGIAGSGKARDLVRQKHEELAKQDPDIYFINTEKMLKTGLYKDKLHFNNKSKIVIGNQFAKTIAKAIKK